MLPLIARRLFSFITDITPRHADALLMLIISLSMLPHTPAITLFAAMLRRRTPLRQLFSAMPPILPLMPPLICHAVLTLLRGHAIATLRCHMPRGH